MGKSSRSNTFRNDGFQIFIEERPPGSPRPGSSWAKSVGYPEPERLVHKDYEEILDFVKERYSQIFPEAAVHDNKGDNKAGSK